MAGAPVVEISDSKVNLEFSAYKKEEETDTYYKSEEPFKVEIDLTDLIGKSFIYSQEEPSNIWSIEHNLNKYPNVQIFDSNDNMTFGEIKHIDKNNLTIRFSAAIGGKAYLG